uniref:SFRICE_021657 n=1 Tax=Spodoptera frugiperda TaxID=7108 RepID=A0A2H1V1T3_SPOFR
MLSAYSRNCLTKNSTSFKPRRGSYSLAVFLSLSFNRETVIRWGAQKTGIMATLNFAFDQGNNIVFMRRMYLEIDLWVHYEYTALNSQVI